MDKQEGRRAGRHPGKMPAGVKLIECITEIQSIFGRMSVTDRDRETTTFKGMTNLAAGMPFYDPGARDPYVANIYLQYAARQAIGDALVSGHLPVWTAYDAQFIELDHETLFGINKWDRVRSLRTGLYLALNTFHGRDGPVRKEYDGATLWVLGDDWPGIRNSLIAQRERAFDSALGNDWPQLLSGTESCFQNRAAGVVQRAPPDASHWSLYEAVAWVGSGDMNFVAQQRATFLAVGEEKTAGAKIWLRLDRSLKDRVETGAGGETAYCARELLRVACEKGAVVATGIPASNGDRRAVPPSDFVASELWPEAGGSLHCATAKKGESALWFDLRFQANDVRAIVDAAYVNHEIPREDGGAPADDVVTRSPVSSRDLRDWVRVCNVDRWSQDKIAKEAADAFPDHDVPGRPTLREIDASVRHELGLPERTRGRRKKGR